MAAFLGSNGLSGGQSGHQLRLILERGHSTRYEVHFLLGSEKSVRSIGRHDCQEFKYELQRVLQISVFSLICQSVGLLSEANGARIHEGSGLNSACDRI